MNTELFVENCYTLTPKDLLLGLGTRADINFWAEDPDDKSDWCISVSGNEPQKIALEWRDITYGARAYFRCMCDYRATKLYLPLNGHEFKCRRCHGLQYQLTTYNRHSVAGKVLYRLNRLQKLSDSRASMGRILYNGNYTKKFERFLSLCDRAGYDSIVKGAMDLKDLIKG